MAPQKGCLAITQTAVITTARSRIQCSQHPARASHLNQQPDPLLSTTPSHAGHSRAANCATESRAMCTHTPPTRTVRTTHTCLTYMHSSPTGSETGALMSILSWAPSREEAHQPPHPLPLGRSTPRSCSPTLPLPPRAAKGARAAPRAPARRFPQKDRMQTAVFTVFWRASFVSS